MKNLIVLLFFVIAYCSLQAQEIEINQINHLLANYEITDGPGMAVGIIKNGKLIYRKNCGLANLEHHIAITDSTVFSLASVAKQFTAACLWVLVKQNKITLDDDIRKYLPELPDYGHTIKIKHLLNHTSGIRNYHTLMYLSGFDYDKEYYDNQIVLDLAVRQQSLNNIPGEKVSYSNTPYNLLAIIIEKISGQNLDEFAAENLFAPLGMKSTAIITDNFSIIKNRASGYAKTTAGYNQIPHISQSYGAGSIVSGIDDMVKWANIINNSNTQYSELSSFLKTTEKLPSGRRASYARGVMIDDYKGLKTVHHSGYGAGGQTQIIMLPQLQIAVIIFTNLESIDPKPVSYAILDIMIKKHAAVAGKKAKKFMLSHPQKFTGQYQEMYSDMKMEISFNNDTLRSKGSNAKKAVALIAFDTGKYYRKGNESVKYEFNTQENAPYDMAISFGGTPFYFKRASFINPDEVTIEDYIGKYYSAELNAYYTFTVNDKNLMLSYKNHPFVKLSPTQKDEFGNGDRVLYTFQRDSNNKIVSFYLSADGTVHDIKFVKK